VIQKNTTQEKFLKTYFLLPIYLFHLVKYPRLPLQSCLLLTKERRLVKIIGTVKTEKKLQKKSLQQNSNNHEPDDEAPALSGKKKKYSRSIFSDKEVADQKPHPGSYAYLEMRTLYQMMRRLLSKAAKCSQSERLHC
jgi:hypothetical protein